MTLVYILRAVSIALLFAAAIFNKNDLSVWFLLAAYLTASSALNFVLYKLKGVEIR